MTENVAIIGNGCGAIAAIEALREHGYEGEITVYSDSVWQPYNPMLTTYYLSGKIDFEGLFPEGKYSEFYTKNRVNLKAGCKITKLDAEKKTLTDAFGKEFSYGKCIVASGASPFVPPIEGHDGENVFVVRTIEDILKIKDYMRHNTVKNALVVGASMVGIKIAEFFAHEHIECCLADAAPNIFPLAAHPSCSAIIEEIVRENGVSLKLGGGILKIEHNIHGSKAYFANAPEPVECDIIIMSIGTRPNIGMIDKTQIETNRAILVDNHMRTSNQNVYAVGDCTEGDDVLTGTKKNIGLLASARYQGHTAGSNIAGADVTYCGSSPHNITHFMDIDFIGIGDIHAEGELFEHYNKKTRQYARIVSRENQILSVNLINLKELSGIFKTLVFQTEMGNESTTGYSYVAYAKQLIKTKMQERKVNG